MGEFQIRESGGKVVEICRPKYIDTGETPLLRSAGEYLRAFFAGKDAAVEFDWAAEGTRYEKAVWGFLSSIRRGETVTYAAVAKAAGGSARSVGNACGKNPLPFIVPCHRVVAAKDLGGYALGREMKQKLLDLERGGRLV
ncbi:MAG: methylated-DNA--[protein]-cysteine S-methyltransferase [Clostridia bacterium]|nr:methylated-DNA--[protein]-cysteine S-methyltransferase [Clostridia bacterium]